LLPCHWLQILKRDVGIGGVVSLLWFQRCLPPYACKFFEMCLMVTADHGPAVSGAHNTIVCARAGKDLVSSLVSGLLTVVSISYLIYFILYTDSHSMVKV
jgi:ATP citrate (pro-S)-lyase